MKIFGAIARYLLALLFLFSGLNLFFNFLHGPLPPGTAGEFLGLLVSTHFAYAIGAVMGISESAAGKRYIRALEKLKQVLSRRDDSPGG